MTCHYRMVKTPKGASTCKLPPKEEVAAYQLVGGVTAYQGYDA